MQQEEEKKEQVTQEQNNCELNDDEKDLQRQDSDNDMLQTLFTKMILNYYELQNFKDLKEYVAQNKPSLQMLLHSFTSAALKDETQETLLIQNLVIILKNILSVKLQRVVMRVILTFFEQNSQNLKLFDVKFYHEQRIDKLWEQIFIEEIPTFIKVFSLNDKIIEKDFALYIDNAIKNKHYDEAIKLVLVMELPKDYLYKIINSMNNNKDCQKAAEIIKKQNLPFNDFENIQERLDKKTLRYLIKEYRWFQCEEMCLKHPKLLVYLVEDLVYSGKQQEALSIIKRHNLLDKIKKEDTKKQLQEQLDKTTQFFDNCLFCSDKYIPTDLIAAEFLEREIKTDLYIFNEQLGLTEKNTYFIDDESSPVFDHADQQLRQEGITGIDTEFTTPFTKLDQDGIILQIVQISKGNEAFIFDAYALAQSNKFKALMSFYLESNSILKIGHSLKDDIVLLCQKLKITNIAVRNILDISNVFKNLNPESKQRSLSHITEHYFKKQLSKFDQCSNWGVRPLRKAQLHYAALDALICVKLYEHISASCDQETLKQEVDSFQVEEEKKKSQQKQEQVPGNQVQSFE